MYLSVVLPHTVSDAHGYVRAHPDSDAPRDLSATDSLAKTLGEHHTESQILRSHREPAKRGGPRCVLNRPRDSPVGLARSVHTAR